MNREEYLPKHSNSIINTVTTNTTHAELCPVCKGTGKVISSVTSPNSTIQAFSHCKCHGCNGLGWVTVSNIVSTRVQ